MGKIKRVALIGLGAIGSAYAQRLNKLDEVDFFVIASGDRKKRLEEGILINEEHCKFKVCQHGDSVDLIIFCTKYHHLDQAIKDVEPFVSKNTLFLSLLNGIDSDEMIAKEYGEKNILYGKSVAIDAVRDKNSVNFSSIGHINFGRLNNEKQDSEVCAVAELFKAADIPYNIPVDMKKAMWWKFMANVGLNQVSAVLGAEYGVMLEVPVVHALYRSAMEEVVEIANAKGINLTSEDMDEVDRVVATLDFHGKTSMLQDVEAGRKTEVEMFAKVVIKMGKEYGIDTFANEMLFERIVKKEQELGLR